VIERRYDWDGRMALARRLAGLDDDAEAAVAPRQTRQRRPRLTLRPRHRHTQARARQVGEGAFVVEDIGPSGAPL
jgi:hypothetical protein